MKITFSTSYSFCGACQSTITESVDIVLNLGIAVMVFMGMMVIIRAMSMSFSLDKDSKVIKENR